MRRLTPAILDSPSFDRLLAPLGPFEHKPKLAIAVSGGADSMALTLLAANWVKAQGGSILALTVDHGLRKDSAAEARQVGRWLAARRINHEILRWTGPKPTTGIQAAARAARYRLLLECCREAGILHLLLAHHQGDQAETVMLRLAGGSGTDGLAAIAPAAPTEQVRLLRPLLAVPKDALKATLTALDQAWIEDPSNRNPAFGRVRMRQALSSGAGAGLTQDDLSNLASDARQKRAARDGQAAALLARTVVLAPGGYATLALEPFAAASDRVGRRALGHLLRTVGGAAYTPRSDRLDRLWADIRAGLTTRRSLGGCLVVPKAGALLVHREPAAVAEPMACRAGDTVHWDGRFTATVAGPGRGKIGALGQAGWLAVKKEAASDGVAASVAATLPALFDTENRPVAVPHLGWRKTGHKGLSLVDLAFTPISPLTGGLVWHPSGTMC